jgi:hypothetical protein
LQYSVPYSTQAHDTPSVQYSTHAGARAYPLGERAGDVNLVVGRKQNQIRNKKFWNLACFFHKKVLEPGLLLSESTRWWICWQPQNQIVVRLP